MGRFPDRDRAGRLRRLRRVDTRAAPGRGGSTPRGRFHDVRVQVGIGPRPAGTAASEEEVRFIALSLRQAGLGGVRVQHPYRNVVARIPGSEPGAVVLGAHHDTKDIPGFVGANDGASGVAVLLELARDLPRRVDGPSIDLAFFDAEESVGPGNGARAFERTGDRGSGQYVRYAERGGLQGAPPLDSIQAMVLFDMVGDCDLRIPLEANSDPALYEPFADAAAASPRAAARCPSRGPRGDRGRSHALPPGGRPSRRPDRLRLRPRPDAGGLVAYAPGRSRPRLRRQPRRGRPAGAGRDP